MAESDSVRNRTQKAYARRIWNHPALGCVETTERIPMTERIQGITVEEFSDLERAGDMIRRYRWRA